MFRESVNTFFVDKESKDKTQAQLEECLSYFDIFEQASKVFNSPGDNVCADPQFIPLINKTETSISFLRSHRYFRDTELYLLKLQQSMLPVSVINSRQSYMSNLGKFKSVASNIRELVSQIEYRVSSIPEAKHILFSLYNHYFNCRKHILNSYITNQLDLIKSKQENLSNSQGSYQGLYPESEELKENFFKDYNTDGLFADYINSTSKSIYQASDTEVTSVDEVSQSPMILYSWCTMVYDICLNESLLLGQFFDTRIRFQFNTKDPSAIVTVYENKEHSRLPNNIANIAASILVPTPNNPMISQLTPEIILFYESFLSLLYDKARPMIISEHDINILSMFCIVLGSFGWASPSSENTLSESNTGYEKGNNKDLTEDTDLLNDYSSDNPPDNLSMELYNSAFYSVIEKLLGDARHKFVFRIQSYIRKWYENSIYNSEKESSISPNSKSQPDTLPESTVLENSLDNVSSNAEIEDRLEKIFKTQYIFPVIKNTLWALDKIKKSTNGDITQDLSNEASLASIRQYHIVL
ncbi:hypothetical protein BB560_000512 [Smittium megazygosporum]|uniref:Conserved oligomeric Golgi complex subunit 3 n=1 Tax=Smittium megazygosporum TaxID=133381 RepID=A0A2T9ZK17_9FUNG|nr:hypothetical protein BB560_000512 [Smittium megazygosporum]